jgi:hypothetical protein
MSNKYEKLEKLLSNADFTDGETHKNKLAAQLDTLANDRLFPADKTPAGKSEIEEMIITKSEYAPKRSGILRFAAAAACICVVLTAAIVGADYLRGILDSEPEMANNESNQNGYISDDYKAVEIDGGNRYAAAGDRYAISHRGGHIFFYEDSDNPPFHGPIGFDALMRLRTEDYRELSVREFYSKFSPEAYRGYISTGQNNNFIDRTLYYTALGNNEVRVRQTWNTAGIRIVCIITWTIHDADNLTVGARDDALNTCFDAVFDVGSGNFRNLQNENIKSMLQTEFDTLAQSVSGDYLTVEMSIQEVLRPLR